MYTIARNRKVMSSTGRAYVQQCWDLLSKSGFPTPPFEKDEAVMVTLEFHRTVQNKTWPKTAKTRFAKWDILNMDKILIDVVFKYLGLDDSQITRALICKRELVQREKPSVLFTISTVPDDSWKR